MNKILVEVSVGELLDKLSILEIKKIRIKDPSKLNFINEEYDIHHDDTPLIDISEQITSEKSKSDLQITTNDYYSQYSKSFFKEHYQKMLHSIQDADEYNPAQSLTKQIEDKSLNEPVMTAFVGDLSYLPIAIAITIGFVIYVLMRCSFFFFL